ncbi:hypothetical protein [Neoroseomonas lacus]|uniref:hypothetical protein n=1 Tax=Neoroseomonas lacus TaxID=287609 RepID=UPI00166C1FDE|nr:hypothetical protein [Neoroseomonas lacus]
MTNDQRPTSIERYQQDSDVMQLALLRRRQRSRALLVVLLGLAALFYAMTMARLGEHSAARQIAAQSPGDGRASVPTTPSVRR